MISIKKLDYIDFIETIDYNSSMVLATCYNAPNDKILMWGVEFVNAIPGGKIVNLGIRNQVNCYGIEFKQGDAMNNSRISIINCSNNKTECIIDKRYNQLIKKRHVLDKNDSIIVVANIKMQSLIVYFNNKPLMQLFNIDKQQQQYQPFVCYYDSFFETIKFLPKQKLVIK